MIVKKEKVRGRRIFSVSLLLFALGAAWEVGRSQQPIGLTAVCSIEESPPFDGMTEKEESQLTTTVRCSDRTFVFPRSLYTFNGCKQVAMEWQDGELIPVKDQPCKVGFVAACRDAIKAKRSHPKPNEPISLMNLANIPACEHVPLTNTLLDSQ